jgi:hypothetical protein
MSKMEEQKRGLLNPVEIWDAECAIAALSQSQSYRAMLVQLKFDGKSIMIARLRSLHHFWTTEVTSDLEDVLKQQTWNTQPSIRCYYTRKTPLPSFWEDTYTYFYAIREDRERLLQS